MQAWQITTKETIEKADRTELLTDIDSVKLRITKALITSEDIVTYLGEDDKVKYPVIPCNAAIGQINELPAESPYFEKGTRVYVSRWTVAENARIASTVIPNAVTNFRSRARIKTDF